MDTSGTPSDSDVTFRYRGHIDFDRLSQVPDPGPKRLGHQHVQRLEAPGIELAWTRDVDVCWNAGAIAIVTGHAESGDRMRAADWLDAYARDADGAADNVGGSFACVVIDVRAQRALLFVDRFAIETLCYRSIDGTLGFADRASAVPGSTLSIDRQAIFDYLYFHMIPAPRTIFADVLRIDAAQRISVSKRGTRASTYWRPLFVEDDRHALTRRLQEFREIVRDSVASDARDGQTACFLSGGTDSSTVAGMLTQIRGSPAHAYSIGFDADGYDEMAYARIAAKHFGLVHHAYYVTPGDVAEAMPKLAASFDQPFGNASVVPAYYCALRAREDGFTHLLAGDGGDELFAGNSRYAMQQVFEFYHRLPQRLRRNLLEPPAANWWLFRRVPGFKQLGGYVRHSRHPMPDRLETFQLMDRLGQEAMFESSFRMHVDPSLPLAQQRAQWDAARANSLVNRMLAYDWKYTLADNDLPKVRMATALAGVTVGFPLLSRRLTDFSLAIPPDWKLRRLKLRWFYKEALRGFLPDEILRKKKHGFGLPFGRWALQDRKLHALVLDSVQGFGARGIVRAPFIDELLTKRMPEVPHYYGVMVWLLAMLEQWLRAQERAAATSEVRTKITTTSPIRASTG